MRRTSSQGSHPNQGIGHPSLLKSPLHNPGGTSELLYQGWPVPEGDLAQASGNHLASSLPFYSIRATPLSHTPTAGNPSHSRSREQGVPVGRTVPVFIGVHIKGWMSGSPWAHELTFPSRCEPKMTQISEHMEEHGFQCRPSDTSQVCIHSSLSLWGNTRFRLHSELFHPLV
jgi:hypothetical protein